MIILEFNPLVRRQITLTTQTAICSRNQIPPGFWIYGWDFENRLTTVRKQNKTVRYQYDALGRRVLRIGKAVGANAKHTYSGWDVILDEGNNGIVKYQNGLGIDNKLKLTSNGVSKYFLQDHLGSTVGLTDQSGAVL